MSSEWLLNSYLLAASVALLILAVFRAARWYWHLLSAVADLAAGLAPPPAGSGGDGVYLVADTTCIFFCLWGLLEPFFAAGKVSQSFHLFGASFRPTSMPELTSAPNRSAIPDT